MEIRRMRRTMLNFEKLQGLNLAALVTVAFFFVVCFPRDSMAQQPGQKTFSSPEEGIHALFTAMQSNNESALLEILGPAGKRIVSSGDATEDADSRANF